MAILRGEEARQWLAQNPNKAYKDLSAGVSVPRQQSGIEKFLYNITKPVRTFLPAVQESAYTLSDLVRAGKGDWKPTERPERYLGMTEEESTAFREDPLKQGLKAGSALVAYGLPVGAAEGLTGTRAVGSAALRGTVPGAMSGFGYSGEGEELSGALTGGALGGLLGGVTQGIGEIGRATKAKPQGGGKIVDTLEVDEIAALPKKVKQGLVDQTKSAGFWDEGIGETKSIQNFLKNRGLAGKTPQETLEKMTQEFYRAQNLKETGIKEIGGLSRGYIDQIKGNIDEAIQFSGLGAKDKSALKEMYKVLDNAPTDAKTLDKIAQDWYKMGLTKAGEQKMTQSGLFMNGAKAIRDALKTVNQGGSYTEGMTILSQILGLEDQGLISKAAQEAARQGIDIPLFAGAGFRGADIKVPQVSNVLNKTRANIGIARETGQGLGGGVLGGVARATAPVASVAQRATPAIVGATQIPSERQPQPQPGVSPLPSQVTGPQIDQMALAQAVLNGDISTSEADWLLKMFGGGAGQQELPKTDSGRKAMVARDTAIRALGVLQQNPSVAGKLQGLENIVYDVTGQANIATEYKALIEGLRSQVFNALGGASLTPTEKAQYERFLPRQSDSPAQARQKLQALIPMMESLMGAESNVQEGSAIYELLYGSEEE